ncbi:XRE family transcriptional regulator [Agromyces laixinhei]|uniref:XRE family transcriptional regulator n=1 Tax=Agromyces laixinhei TaxID=2585717 RepID=UPI0011167F9A|nr:XRE family transcriptional regulator [Agromyces laixinhei]
MAMTSHLTPDLARAARALTQVSAKVIAADADIEKQRVRRFEKGGEALSLDEQERLLAVLESYGVVFIDEDSVGGYGVRRKFTDAKVRRLETWEGEGGPVADDSM